jgi:hypothetical protein
MGDEELATEQEKQEVLAKLKAFLDQIEELEAKWRDLPEEQKLALPELVKFLGIYDADPCNPALRSRAD